MVSLSMITSKKICDRKNAFFFKFFLDTLIQCAYKPPSLTGWELNPPSVIENRREERITSRSASLMEEDLPSRYLEMREHQ